MRHIQSSGIVNTTQDPKTQTERAVYMNIQTLLQAIDAYAGPITGQSEDLLPAVKAFQNANQLKIDGKVGMRTFMAMAAAYESRMAAAYPSPSRSQEPAARTVVPLPNR